MKLQIDGQQWRLRVAEDELQELLAGRCLAVRSVLPTGAVLCVELALAAAAAARFEHHGDAWRIALPAATIAAHAARLPCRDGVAFAFPVRAGVVLALSFEVDVHDSRRRRAAAAADPAARGPHAAA